MAGQRPRQGWIYMINPYRVSLRCHNGHRHFYELEEPGEVNCKRSGCSQTVNSSRVQRGSHPYIIWTSDEFLDELKKFPVFNAIPLTSQTTFSDFPTTYSIANTTKNGLTCRSYALVHQITTIESNCLRDGSGNWIPKMGILPKKDKDQIQRRLAYLVGFDNSPSEDWFQENASRELLKKVFGFLPEGDREGAVNDLLDEF